MVINDAVRAGLEGLRKLQGAGSDEEAMQIYCQARRNMENAGSGEEVNVQQLQQGIAVPENLAFQVLSDSLSYRFKEQAGTKFPTLYVYVKMDGEDVDKSFVARLRDEFVQVRELVRGDLELRVVQGEDYASVRAFEGQGSLSPHAPVMARATIKRKVEYNAKSRLGEIISDAVAMCNEAIRRNCGFGKYSREA